MPGSLDCGPCSQGMSRGLWPRTEDLAGPIEPWNGPTAPSLIFCSAEVGENKPRCRWPPSLSCLFPWHGSAFLSSSATLNHASRQLSCTLGFFNSSRFQQVFPAPYLLLGVSRPEDPGHRLSLESAGWKHILDTEDSGQDQSGGCQKDIAGNQNRANNSTQMYRGSEVKAFPLGGCRASPALGRAAFGS